MVSQTDTGRITVRVAGREHRDWTTYRIDSHLITPADAWQVTLGIPADAMPNTVKPWAEVEICLGQDVVLTGRIDRIEREVAKSGEVCVYNQSGAKITLKEDKLVAVECKRLVFDVEEDITMTAKRIRAVASERLGLYAPEWDMGGDEDGGECEGVWRGNQHITGTSRADVDHVSGGVSLVGHVHRENDGGGPTDRPLE